MKLTTVTALISMLAIVTNLWAIGCTDQSHGAYECDQEVHNLVESMYDQNGYDLDCDVRDEYAGSADTSEFEVEVGEVSFELTDQE
jgi:hypothetical protein